MFYQSEHMGTVGYFKREERENFNYPLHLHQSFELIFLESGEMTVTVNGADYELSAGDAVFIPSNQMHSMRTVSHSAHKLIIFAPNLVSVFTKKMGDRVPAFHKFRPCSLCVDMLLGISVDSPVMEKKSLLYYLCSEFHKNAEYIEPQSGPAPLIYRIFEFIQSNYGGACSLYGLSVATGYDYSYLSSYFKRIVGISFNEYVNQVRISHAGYLLANTDLSILGISTECGYKSLRSFNRNFKEHLGVTPSEYRHKEQ